MQILPKAPITKNKLLIITGGFLAMTLVFVGLVLIVGGKHSPKSISPPKSVSLGKEYTDTATNLTITPPANWSQVSPTQSGDIVDFRADAKDFDSIGEAHSTLSVVKTQASGSLAQYADAIGSINAKNLSSYQASKPRDLQIDGQPAKILNYTAKVSGHIMRAAQLLVIKDHVLYDFNGVGLAASWDKHEAEIGKSFASIKLPEVK